MQFLIYTFSLQVRDEYRPSHRKYFYQKTESISNLVEGLGENRTNISQKTANNQNYIENRLLLITLIACTSETQRDEPYYFPELEF